MYVGIGGVSMCGLYVGVMDICIGMMLARCRLDVGMMWVSYGSHFGRCGSDVGPMWAMMYYLCGLDVGMGDICGHDVVYIWA